MKRIRIVGLCLLAAFALSALAASSSSAQTYKVCKKAPKVEKKYTGKYTNKECTKEASSKEIEEGKKNEYELGEWNEGKEKEPKFKGKNGPSTLYLYVSGFGVVATTECAKASNEGHITGPKTGNVQVTFEKCTSSGEVCTSPGAKAGDIKTALLKTELAEKEGKVIVRVGEKGALSAEFTCGENHIRTTGVADGVDTGNVNHISKESTQTFSVNSKGEQENTVDGDVLVTEVTGVGTFNSGEETTSVLKGEEMEIESP